MLNICMVIDIAGFYINKKFYPRELGCSSLTKNEHKSFRFCLNNFFSEIREQDKSTVSNYTNIHGLSFNSIPVERPLYNKDKLFELLKTEYVLNKTEKKFIVAYRGYPFERIILEKLKIPCVNLKTYNCPNINHLPPPNITNCNYHILNSPNICCPKVKCFAFAKWIKDEIEWTKSLLYCYEQSFNIQEIRDDGLSVNYIEKFYSKEDSDKLFQRFKKYPFKEFTLTFNNLVKTPLRKMCVFGDPNCVYEFSGLSVKAEPWTPLLFFIKKNLECFAKCSYNFVLMNLYPNGCAQISPHKDNEESLDKNVPIAGLSFGACRNMKFTRKNFSPHSLPLQHGSLVLLYPPTNMYWNHSIPPQRNVGPRISLTFRKIKMDT